ncbi:MAG: Smr/MutS family protein [Phaeovulum sp.]|uniref:Smr/MutS family protein n=1 Tax=Phaeovulum sp. TaxID=2934796 RepID=UPI0027375446|nr:Smr/MutS family protein [Phaeovulum sp.]MDP3861287.1 Smr/MutS family protein [Phaeovulum sp.]
MHRRPRKLSPEERELWAQVAASAVALHAPHPAAGEASQPKASATRAHQPPRLPRADLAEFRIGQAVTRAGFGHDPAPGIAERLAQAPLSMDMKAHRKMSRGRLSPEARIDLHGMTLAGAHPELIRFILRAQDSGLRLVLVITGKGRLGADDGPIPMRHGILRHQVPHWLHQVPLSASVLQVAQAHLRHGGTGAYYVYLRRAR